MKHDKQEIETTQSQGENYNFVQVNRSFLKSWRALTKRCPLATEILMYLLETMGRTSNAVVCSYQTLVDVTQTSRPSVGRAIKILKDERWVETVKVGSATAYCVNAAVFWQAARNQKSYAMFHATVVASADEQPSDFHDRAKEPLRHIPFVDKKRQERVIANDEQLPPPDQIDLPLQ